jgi:hypothetical protein
MTNDPPMTNDQRNLNDKGGRINAVGHWSLGFRHSLVIGHWWVIGHCVALVAGCSNVEQSPALTQTDVKLSQPAYWIALPAADTVTHDDYDQLWEAAVDAARWHGFRVDRSDYRNGLLITHPVVSKQIFELWRRDVATLPDMTESTLATMRRIVRFEIAKGDDGTFACVPKVLVERFTSTERRITSVTQYRESFNILPGLGSRERDKGVNIPETYWYTTARDEELERQLAEGIRSRLRMS